MQEQSGEGYNCVAAAEIVPQNVKLESKFGGPLVCKNKDTDKLELQGISSLHSKNMDHGAYGLFTNMALHLDWIQGEMSKLSSV